MILYGKPVAESIYKTLANQIENFKKQGITPSLAVILVGNDPASLVYIKVKEKVAHELGVIFKLYHFPETVSENDLEILIRDLNQNKYIHGILIQLPLPQGFSDDKIIKTILPDKDIDGFLLEHPATTAAAILEILNYYNVELNGKNIVLVGYGQLVGKPLEKLLMKKGIKPLVCDSNTKNIEKRTLEADILISAVGIPGLIKQDMVKSNAIIIDAGTAESSGKMIGDVSPEVYEKVDTYTPNPGGVGPVTVAQLMKNLVEAAKNSIR